MPKLFHPKSVPKPKLSQLEDAKSGFTLVELTLTLAFVSVLLITIAIITSNIMTIYQKGTMIKAVDSVGRGLIDELVSGINSAPSVDTTSLCNSFVDSTNRAACIKDHAFKFIFHSRRDTEGNPLYGVFCTGNYSYVWNTKALFESGGTPLIISYQTATGPVQTPEDMRLLRFEDHSYRICTAVVDKQYRDQGPFADVVTSTTIDIRKLPSGANYTITEPIGGLLNAYDLNLMLYDLTIFPISQDPVTLRTYMSGTFILATERGNIDIQRTGDYCSLDDTGASIESIGSEFNYCAINKFNFAARTAGV